MEVLIFSLWMCNRVIISPIISARLIVRAQLLSNEIRSHTNESLAIITALFLLHWLRCHLYLTFYHLLALLTAHQCISKELDPPGIVSNKIMLTNLPSLLAVCVITNNSCLKNNTIIIDSLNFMGECNFSHRWPKNNQLFIAWFVSLVMVT